MKNRAGDRTSASELTYGPLSVRNETRPPTSPVRDSVPGRRLPAAAAIQRAGLAGGGAARRRADSRHHFMVPGTAARHVGGQRAGAAVVLPGSALSCQYPVA